MKLAFDSSRLAGLAQAITSFETISKCQIVNVFCASRLAGRAVEFSK